jgi:tetratricopeptide (TPR) repeat protein
MIRHQVYFDTLGSTREDSASWRSVFAGLSVLRLVDAYESASPVNPGGWAQLHSVRAAIEDLNEGDPVRGVLTRILEETTNRGEIDETILRSLVAYGRVLDYEANWGLATDVFATVAKLVRPDHNARLAVEAHVALGGAARRNGDWEVSARAYSQGAYIADTLGDRRGVLTVQVGIANTYLAKGNFPQAQSILDDVIIQARDQELPEIQGMALHSRSALAQRKGERVEAVKLAHDALELTSNPTERDLVLEDLAVAFSEVGLRDASRDAHLILAATAQTKWVRWQATINLMELASLDGMEAVFDNYASELRSAPMGTWLRSHFLLFLGEGLERFGRYEAAEQAFEEAVAYTTANQIHAVTFRAEELLRSVRAKSRLQTATPVFQQIPLEVLAAAHAISELRKAAVPTAVR